MISDGEEAQNKAIYELIIGSAMDSFTTTINFAKFVEIKMDIKEPRNQEDILKIFNLYDENLDGKITKNTVKKLL